MSDPAAGIERAVDLLEEATGHSFSDRRLAATALIHRSFRHENPTHAFEDNERLEHVGDAVVGLYAARLLYRRFPDSDQGGLTRMRAALVNARSLSEMARRAGLSGLVMLGTGEQRTGGREKTSILADLFEAVVGALYLDGGETAACLFLDPLFSGCGVQEADRLIDRLADYKSSVLEWCKERGRHAVWEVTGTSGPEHERMYEVALLIDGQPAGHGRGASKKEAEQAAAAEAYPGLGRD